MCGCNFFLLSSSSPLEDSRTACPQDQNRKRVPNDKSESDEDAASILNLSAPCQ